MINDRFGRSKTQHAPRNHEGREEHEEMTRATAPHRLYPAAPSSRYQIEMRFLNVAWIGAAATLLTITAAVNRVLKARRSHWSLTPVSDQWLAHQKRERDLTR
jgi:hypothetical protein